MRPATIFQVILRRGDGFAVAEEGSGEESARLRLSNISLSIISIFEPLKQSVYVER